MPSTPSRRPIRIALNGFGRIGRTIVRLLATSRADAGIEIVCINDIASLSTCAYLFEFDSIAGVFAGTVETSKDALIINGQPIRFTSQAALDRVDLTGVDVVLECTGRSNSRLVAEQGLTAGAARVLISGPSPAADYTVVLGANEDGLKDQQIVSNASCTTNALAPILKLLDETYGISSAHMTTIHCYTSSQPTIDKAGPDLARSRAAALSMVPTTTSAARMIDAVLPELAGRVSVTAVRVPVASVSAIDLIVSFKKQPKDGVEWLRAAIGSSDVMGWTDKPLVSSDLKGRPESLILAGPETIVGPDFTRLFGWYDNEWGFSNRMIDVALRMGAAKGGGT